MLFCLVLLVYLVPTDCATSVSDCKLTLKTDFGEPSPVYIKNGTYLAPNTPSGDILIRRSETLLVACPGKRKFVVLGNDTTDANYLEVRCVAGDTFRAGRWFGQFKDIKCNSPPWFTAEETSAICADRSKLFKVGYQINGKFYTLYEACFNRDMLSTLYVHHAVTPSSHFIQTVGRPNFIEGDVFGKTKMSKVYAIENQKTRFRATLGNGADQKYITKKQFLNRGHLAPKADFVMRATQKASFHYVNAAPQWMSGNAGDWAALEDPFGMFCDDDNRYDGFPWERGEALVWDATCVDTLAASHLRGTSFRAGAASEAAEALRRRIGKLGRIVSVYTGTAGVSWLPDSGGQDRELFLHADENNNAVVPVPLYFFKLVYDQKEKKAAAFVSINSSYYDKKTTDDLTFCNDICDDNPNYSWLKWRPRDGTHSFCCEYGEFIQYVSHLPRLNVTGLFY